MQPGTDDRQAGRRNLELLARLLFDAPGLVYEVRGIGEVRGNPNSVASGYFDNAAAFVRAAESLDGRFVGVYFVINPVRPDLIARAANRIQWRPKTTTADRDVLRRRWLFVDVDPTRPAGISSTDEQVEDARKVRDEVVQYLGGLGFPEPLLGDSGNGAHGMYCIDLPADDGGLVSRVLAALAFRFDTATVTVDQSVHSAAQLGKVFGTMACKGDSVPDRPHRRSRITTLPEPLLPVRVELLERVAGEMPRVESPKSMGAASGSQFDLEGLLARGHVCVHRTSDWNGGTRWIFNPCPFNPEHTDGAAFLVRFPSGALAAGCHHNGCAGKTWHDLRRILEPGWEPYEPAAFGPGQGGGAPSGSRAEEIVEPPLGTDFGASDEFHTPEPKGRAHPLIIEMNRDGSSSSDLFNRAVAYARAVPGAQGQKRHRAAATLAANLAALEDEAGLHLNAGEILAVLATWNATCDPPLSDEELAKAVDTGLGKKRAPKKANSKRRANQDRDAGDAEAGSDRSGEDDVCRKLTDTGNAERFVDRFGARARHCHPWKKWLTWNGHAWAVDGRGTAMRWSKDVVRGIYTEARFAPDELREAIAEWAVHCEKLDRRRALVELAKSEHGIPVDPDELDQDPWLLNCRNGTVDLKTGTLREHRREDYLTMTAPVAFDPNAEAKHWVEFLDRVIPDAEVREFIQRAAGYSLTGDVGEQVLFFLLGGGANGKSTFLRMLQEAMGMAYAIQAAPDLLLSKHSRNHPTELADLFRVRLAVCMEVGSDRSFDEVIVKQVTGGDRIRARRMKEDFWEFDPTHKLWLGANHRPKVQGTDDAIWRRILVVPFPVFIPEDQRDKKLVSKLRRELPGILAWAVRGCLDWQRDGLNPPDQVRLAVQDYRSEMDVVGRFLDEACVFASHLQVGATELYTAYQSWCSANGVIAGTQNELSSRVIQRGAERKKRGVFRYFGVALRGRGDTTHDPRGPSGPFGPDSTLLATRGHTRAPKHAKGPEGPKGPENAPSGAANGGSSPASQVYETGHEADTPSDDGVQVDPELRAVGRPIPLRRADDDGLYATEDGQAVRFSKLTLLGNGIYLTPAGQEVRIVEQDGGVRG